MNDREVVHEFLIESTENLARLDQEMVELEQRPKDIELLSSIFRTIHTIKGTCGFLGFSTLERITHLAENILSQLRTGGRELDSELVSLILETVDATRSVLGKIEATGLEGQDTYEDLRRRLDAACNSSAAQALVDSSATGERLDANGLQGQKVGSVADSTIRVDVGLLDKLGNLVGELVLTRNQILQFNAQHENATLNATSQRLNLITSELQEGVMKTRMQPIGVVWNKLPRVVRDLAASFGKQVRLDMDGAGTELDKTIIEAIKDPLTHIVRNCCDHGIEKPDVRLSKGKPSQGTILLRAFHEGGQVNIEITDNGAGIDTERVKTKALLQGLLRPEEAARASERDVLDLLFLPGFSTADTVTNVSGRGVGMDVVKTNIERIGGVVDLTSRLGQGTTLKLKIPLTLAIIPGLIVTVGERRSAPRDGSGRGERFVIPQVNLLELIRLEGDAGRKQIEWVHGTRVYRRRGSLLPVAYLNEVVGIESATNSEVVNIVVLQAEDRQFGLVVDGINDTQEIVVKPLGKQLKGLNCYAGATIMGDGRVALILDVQGIGQQSGVVLQTGESKAQVEKKVLTFMDRQTLLLFRAGSFGRLAVPLSLVARLEEFPRSKVEQAGGRMVVQYRGRILPLAPLGPILEANPTGTVGAIQDPVPVIVFNDGDRSVGILVDQICDIVQETVTVRQNTSRRGLLGSAVVGNKVTDFLDLQAVVDASVEDWFGERTGGKGVGVSVMVAEGSPFTRGLVRCSLEMAGYRVVEAANREEALREIERRKIDLLVTALDLPPQGGFDLLDHIRSQPDGKRIPALALANTADETREHSGNNHDFQDYQMKFDRAAMLRSIEKLAAAIGKQELDPAIVGQKGLEQ